MVALLANAPGPRPYNAVTFWFTSTSNIWGQFTGSLCNASFRCCHMSHAMPSIFLINSVIHLLQDLRVRVAFQYVVCCWPHFFETQPSSAKSHPNRSCSIAAGQLDGNWCNCVTGSNVHSPTSICIAWAIIIWERPNPNKYHVQQTQMHLPDAEKAMNALSEILNPLHSSVRLFWNNTECWIFSYSLLCPWLRASSSK